MFLQNSPFHTFAVRIGVTSGYHTSLTVAQPAKSRRNTPMSVSLMVHLRSTCTQNHARRPKPIAITARKDPHVRKRDNDAASLIFGYKIMM
jgi:hypothetical protein